MFYNKLLRTVFILLFFALASGCATTQKMGISQDAKQLTLNDEALLLLAVELQNDLKPKHQPRANVLHLELPEADEKSERFNFILDKQGRFESTSGNKYLIRASIKPGTYDIEAISGSGGKGILVNGSFILPLANTISIGEVAVYYLGNINAVLRQKKEGEFPAGAKFPLIDQAATGFGAGTFDVNITDNREEDLHAFGEEFPALKGVEVISQVLPPFDRGRFDKR